MTERPLTGRPYNYSQLSFSDVSSPNFRDGSKSSHFLVHNIQLQQSASDTSIDANNMGGLLETKRERRVPIFKRIVNMGWWWEIGSTLLALICTALMAAILFTMDGKAMEKWKLPIRPNSLVSIFSTIAKSALLYPIAECIGQLKWEYFDAPRTRPLRRLHAFDTASRGPWGAFTFVWYTRGTATLASIGAIITVCMLAFEPFTQQIISTSARSALRTNETATVLATNTWFEPDIDGQVLYLGDFEKIVYPLTTALMGTLLKPMPLEPTFSYCPTSHCKFPDFTTLGVCSNCTHVAVSNDYFDTCEYLINRPGGKNETYNSLSKFQDAVREGRTTKQKNKRIYSAEGQCTKYLESPYDFRGIKDRVVLFLDMYWISDAPDSNLSPIKRNSTGYRWRQSWDGTLQGIFYDGARYLQEFRLVGMRTPSRTTLFRMRGFNSTTELSRYSDFNQIGVINGSYSFCQLDLCARTYRGCTMENGRWSSTTVEEKTLVQIGNETVPNDDSNRARARMNITFQASKLQDVFRVGNSGYGSLENTMDSVFENVQFIDGMHRAPFNRTINGNWTEFTGRLASALSSILASPKNSEAKNVTGEAYGQEIYLEVRWRWIIGPLSMVFVSTVFLVLTIVSSSRKQYLFKTSILAVLYHGFERRDTSSSEAEIDGGRKTGQELYVRSKDVRVRLGNDKEGSLKLKKE